MNFSKVVLAVSRDYRKLGDEIRKQTEQTGIPVMLAPGESDEARFREAAAVVSRGEAGGGIVLSGSGMEGMLLGNKFPGVRASRATSSTTAMYTRCHNDSNLLSLGAEITGAGKMKEITASWLSHDFIGGRHSISVGMIREGEEHQFVTPGAACSKPVGSQTCYPVKRVFLACDHAGFEAKGVVRECLQKRQIKAMDLGTDSTEIVRYPYYAARVAQAVLHGEADGGILLCGTGIGMSIAANKFKGIRAALCTDTITARLARFQFDSNVLCIGGKIVGTFELEEILSQWLDTPYCGEDSLFMEALRDVECNYMKETDWKPTNPV